MAKIWHDQGQTNQGEKMPKPSKFSWTWDDIIFAKIGWIRLNIGSNIINFRALDN
jgi:hypothetical protein